MCVLERCSGSRAERGGLDQDPRRRIPPWESARGAEESQQTRNGGLSLRGLLSSRQGLGFSGACGCRSG